MILRQVSNGVAVRMAVLYLLSGGAAGGGGAVAAGETKAAEGKQVA